MSNISWLKYIKWYQGGTNSNNTHFKVNQRLYIEKKNSKREKSFKPWKLNAKYCGYLILPSLDKIKP